MDDSLGGMFKLTGSNYSAWKSKMRDMLVVKDLWLPVQFGDEKPDKFSKGSLIVARARKVNTLYLMNARKK